MNTEDGKIQCEECEAQIENHRWGKTKAQNWFFTRDGEKAYCPKHVPSWVEDWREKRART